MARAQKTINAGVVKKYKFLKVLSHLVLSLTQDVRHHLRQQQSIYEDKNFIFGENIGIW